jgi:Rad3-related DNA helicase
VLTSSLALIEVGPTLAQQVPVLSTAEALADYAMQPKWSTPALITSAALSGNENFSKMIGDKELKQIIDSADVKFQEDLCNLKRLQ